MAKAKICWRSRTTGYQFCGPYLPLQLARETLLHVRSERGRDPCKGQGVETPSQGVIIYWLQHQVSTL